MGDNADFAAAETPRVLWVELTSKCPFDCVFCSRELRRGKGTHLPFAVYASMVEGLADPRKLLLNYSGESTVYPDLIPAIQRARAAGASVELVSAMASVPEALLGPLSRSGLGRLTVSVHAVSAEKFAEIYRHGSFDALRARLARFLELCRAEAAAPVVDLAFVAMDRNLTELAKVAALGSELGLGEITIFPVLRRDPIPDRFASELTEDGGRRPEFAERLRAAVNAAERSHAGIRFTLPGEPHDEAVGGLGAVPIPYSRALPEGALIHSCEQNPWETAHVLSNGDVVACEALDRIPLGNLLERSMGEIWHGAAYENFRARYRWGEVTECRACAWKRAYLPGPRASEIVAARGLHAQLLYGWHEPGGEDHIWSSQQAALALEPRAGSRTLHLSGMLPPGTGGQPNRLEVRVNGSGAGGVTNPWEETMPFGLDFPVAPEAGGPWRIELRTSQVYRPAERGAGSDRRDLGFALVLAVSKEFTDPEQARQRAAALKPLRSLVATSDRWGRWMRGRWKRAEPALSGATWQPGISILIPEWDNAAELAACLEGARAAAREWTEPVEIVVVVNGSPESAYRALGKAHPEVRWRYYARRLGFAGAVRAGLRTVRHDWVYLLNSDVELERGALRELAPLRRGGTFSIASQIVLKDATRFRDETNWGALLVEDGLATIHDWIPQSMDPVQAFYGGGGASLFRACLLRELLDARAYDPFYWEDVEWGWRARKLGYDAWYCPASIAHHTQRSTIGRHYTAEAVERIVGRNRLLFQLRNFTTAGSLERVMEEIAGAPQEVGTHFRKAATRWGIARGRWWNHLAPVGDEEVLARWASRLPNGEREEPR